MIHFCKASNTSSQPAHSSQERMARHELSKKLSQVPRSSVCRIPTGLTPGFRLGAAIGSVKYIRAEELQSSEPGWRFHRRVIAFLSMATSLGSTNSSSCSPTVWEQRPCLPRKTKEYKKKILHYSKLHGEELGRETGATVSVG